MQKVASAVLVVSVVVILAAAMTYMLSGDGEASACRDVDARLLRDIETGIADDSRLTTAQMVRSDDHENVWFVLGEMDNGQRGIWATDRVTPDGTYTATGLIYAVDDDAHAVSGWGDATQLSASLGPDSDAAIRARSCSL